MEPHTRIFENYQLVREIELGTLWKVVTHYAFSDIYLLRDERGFDIMLPVEKLKPAF